SPSRSCSRSRACAAHAAVRPTCPRRPAQRRRAADAAHAPAPGLRISLPVTAAVAALAAAGAVLVSTSATPVAVADREQRLTVLDWNLHYGVSATPSVDLDEVVAIVRDSGAQVVTLQEVSRGWVLGGGVDMASYLARETGLEVEFVGAADRQFGNAILWNPDVVAASDVARLALPLGAGPQNRSTVSATFTPVDGDTSWPDGVRVTSVHLQHREANAPTRLDQLGTLFAAEPVAGPYLLAGDLNAEPGWEEIELVESHGLVSGQDDVGDPGDLTSPADAPAYRIDWVFGAGLEFQRVTVLDVAWSDHRPLVAVVRPSGTEQE
ncbi:endonuclease/exonuclease/phosphatase family protein, partial [Oerskovia enterophila]|uniref:endonuclease/exonuclease/phosphatase family protein n=1 Tax=Oerskovia enterophila TaxID=43678 RepID=UPI000A51CEAB